MSTRNIKDAKDLSSGELIYFKGHAKATYMSDGTTVEDAINNIEVGSGGNSGEINVQSDWNVTDSDSPAYIKNKPTTLEGYGITDCKIDHDTGNIVIGNTTCSIGDTLTGLYPDGDALSIATVNSDNGDALDLGVQYASTNRYGVVRLSYSTNTNSNSLVATASAVKAAYDLANGRQEKLVSGTNIKTINGESILGSGNISISSGSSSSGSSAYSEVSHGTSDTTFTLTPNVFHVWDEVASLTLDFGSETSGVANEFLFQFNSGSTATTLTLPDTIKWANDSAPTIEANKTYQISILKGLASVLVFENTQIIENKITMTTVTELMSYSFTAQYPVTSDITINTTQGSSWPMTIGGTTTSLDFPPDFITEDPVITSISPAQDDNYIYTW